MKTNLLIFITLFICGSLRSQLLVDTFQTEQQDSLQAKAKLMSVMASAEDPYLPSLPQLLLPSPESQVFQRFTGFDPNYATGAVNVAIPLHTVSCGDFTMPLTLAYQNNGIKVNDPCFPLGYGWVLHPGLRITRTVRGRPDETWPNKSLIPNATYAFPENLKDIYYGRRNTDYQHDIFTIVLPSGNCTFLLERESDTALNSTWQVIMVDGSYTVQVLEATSGNPRFYGFIVRDDKGIDYYFGNENNSTWDYLEHTPDESGTVIPTTFYLRKIVLPGNEEISFRWNKVSSSSTMSGFEYQACYRDYIQNYAYDSPLSETPKDFEEVDSYSESLRSSDHSCTLSEVIAPNFEIYYTYTKPGAHGAYLSQINVMTPNRKQLIKNIKLDISDKLLRRITINDQEKYNFEYNPQRFEYDKGQDFWGYYNGKNNSRLYPTVTFAHYSNLGIAYTSPYTLKGADRTPSEVFMMANMLTKITYPTGGYTTFQYEPHKYNECIALSGTRKMSLGGGVRLRKSESYTSISDTSPLVKTYKYGTDENGYGICSIEPNEDTFISESYQFSSSASSFLGFRLLNVLNNSRVSEYLQFNPPVWYKNVTEYSSEGKTVYTYNLKNDIMYSFQTSINSFIGEKNMGIPRHFLNYGIEKYYNVFCDGLQLTKKDIYNTTKLVSSEIYEYTTINLAGNLTNVYIVKARNNTGKPEEIGEGNEYDYLPANIELVTRKLSRVIKTENTGYGSIRQVTEYVYSQPPLCNIINSTTTDSRGKKVTEKYLYIDSDLSELSGEQKSITSSMRAYNRRTTPVCIKKTVDDHPVFQKVIQYKLVPGEKNPFFVPEKEYFRTEANPEELRVHYTHYNKYGKPTCIKMDDATQIVYIWSYKNQYPIAEIRNAGYEQLTTIISEAVLDALSDKTEPTDSDWDVIHNLRSNTLLQNALITTYRYKPLVGITEITDPAGFTTQYEYDTCNRLKATYILEKTTTAEENKQIVNSYNYNYRNQ